MTNKKTEDDAKKLPSYKEVESLIAHKLGKEILGEKMEMQLGLDEKISLYTAYLQYRASERIEKSSIRVERLTFNLFLITAILVFIGLYTLASSPEAKVAALIIILAICIIGGVTLSKNRFGSFSS